MPTHTDPCEDTIDLVRGIFARGYQAACVDMGAVVKTRPADITPEQAHQIRSGIASLGERAEERYMQLMNTTPARSETATQPQDATAGGDLT